MKIIYSVNINRVFFNLRNTVFQQTEISIIRFTLRMNAEI